VYNCPNTETYWVNKIHIGRGEAWPDIFHIRTFVHCVTNLSWFCNQTSYLMFSILGQWIYHDFESIQPCISSFSFPWFCLHISPLTPFFSYYDNKFILLFILSQWCKGDNSNWLNKILHWNLLGQYQPIILWDLT
jgi:hypothetical protein